MRRRRLDPQLERKGLAAHTATNTSGTKIKLARPSPIPLLRTSRPKTIASAMYIIDDEATAG